MSNLVKAIGIPAMLEQTAEEASELAFACLKLARMLRNENKVYGRSKEELVENLNEEIADITICFQEMLMSNIVSEKSIANMIELKCERMKHRLEEDLRHG